MNRSHQTPRQRLLLVGIEQAIDETTIEVLGRAGNDVTTAVTQRRALQAMRQRGLPDLLVVDAGCALSHAMDFCRKVQRFSDLPIVLLTTEDNPKLIVQALNDVAEDVVVRPFSAAVLAVRIQRIVNRLGRVDDRLTAVDWPTRRLIVGDTAVRLSPTECRLLFVLLREHGETARCEFILRRLWPHVSGERSHVRTAVFRLRRKLESAFGQDVIVAENDGYALHARALDRLKTRSV